MSHTDDEGNIALDPDGAILPYTSDQVRAYLDTMLEDGDLIAAIVRAKNGDVGVQVFGPPSLELLGILEAATRGYRRALKGAKGH